ncbi:MAG: hypothetical protein KA250_18665 [Verrucomicrobiales bacterium]|jgi:hypothetical protein|nr:hypothetical protein [Verrucomicrobiales bacterium]
MTVFVYKPSNDFIGRFSIDSISELSDEFQTFAKSHVVTPYDYLECSGEIWTLVETDEGQFLQEGRINSTLPSTPSSASGLEPPKPSSNRYRDAYISAKATNALGSIIKGLGVCLGILVLLISFVLASEFGGSFILVGLVFSVAVAVPVYVNGILIAAQGQILSATLDNAVYSSPFLSLEEKAMITCVTIPATAETNATGQPATQPFSK